MSGGNRADARHDAISEHLFAYNVVRKIMDWLSLMRLRLRPYAYSNGSHTYFSSLHKNDKAPKRGVAA